MASPPFNSGEDIEAQLNVLQPPEEVGGGEAYEVATPQSHTSGDTSPPLLPSGSLSPDLEAVPVVSQAEAHGESEVPKMNTMGRSEPDEARRHTQTQTGQGQIQAKAQAHTPAEANGPPVSRSRSGSSRRESTERRMIGDFDDSANALWTLYGKEAKRYDESQIQTLKDDMDGVLIFAGLFSASLTSFIISSVQNLQPDPAQQTVYLLQKNLAMLVQISQQLASIAPQASIPSPPTPSLPAFSPHRSDILVNVFWFMALVFSLSAAFLAILVQKWVRDYMHVFQRYSDPLKSARLRQYLYEGSKGWYMPFVAEAVPGLLHVSLFLFFAGLCDFVLNINAAVGISTTVPIGISGLLYIFTMFAPIIYPQSPYKNTVSSLIWYLIQKLGGRKFKDRGSEALKSVSSNMAQGKMQLAMEETEERMGRDERAIRWLAGNMSEDAEMELFVMAIPGSFNMEWGLEVWKKVSSTPEDDIPPVVRHPRVETTLTIFNYITHLVRTCTADDPHTDARPPLPAPHPSHSPNPSGPPVPGEDVVYELSAGVSHLLETCKNHGLFANDELWRKRTRACIETMVLLVCCVDAKRDWFGNITKLLGDIGKDQKTRESSSVGKDQSFVMRWTCLSLMAIGPILEHNWSVRGYARYAVTLLKEDDTDHPPDPTSVQVINETFGRAWTYLKELCLALTSEANPTKQRVQEILNNHDLQLQELEQFNVLADDLREVDQWIFYLQSCIGIDSHEIITCQLPGVQFDEFYPGLTPLNKTVESFRDPLKLQLVLPGQNLRSICSPVATFRDIQKGQWNADAFQETLKDLGAFIQLPPWQGSLLRRQLWRLQDLLDGGGLGFTVELFFLALRQLLPRSSPNDSHSTLYLSTFRAITSNWNNYRDSLGTQKVLLHMVVSDHGIISDFEYPTYITDELLTLLGNLLRGRRGQHINDAIDELTRQYRFEHRTGHREWWSKALDAITQTQAPST
ncbi:hypothetical protein BJV74DRAFT_883684 [Russula compacta]|nr:hypothetical protein BJV74DRAFT_883684 [Russula compacta]